MSKMSKRENKLILITGKMGAGKSSIIETLKNMGFNTFKMDDYIREIYKKAGIGYELILKEFGNEFVTEVEVNKPLLRELILNSDEAKNKLNNLFVPIMESKVKELKSEPYKDSLIFVELAVYIFFVETFKPHFSKIIAIEKKGDFFSENKFFQDTKNIIFSTKHVENSKKRGIIDVISVDYIVENIGGLENLEKSAKNILNFVGLDV